MTATELDVLLRLLWVRVREMDERLARHLADVDGDDERDGLIRLQVRLRDFENATMSWRVDLPWQAPRVRHAPAPRGRMSDAPFDNDARVPSSWREVQVVTGWTREHAQAWRARYWDADGPRDHVDAAQELLAALYRGWTT